MNLKLFLLVGFGGALGAMARFGLSNWVQHLTTPAGFPYGTLVVNVLGCFAIGVLAYLADILGVLTPEVRLLTVTGFLGGFTTFSTFGQETLNLWLARAPGAMLAYLGLHLALGLGAVWLGRTLAQWLWK